MAGLQGRSLHTSEDYDLTGRTEDPCKEVSYMSSRWQSGNTAGFHVAASTILGGKLLLQSPITHSSLSAAEPLSSSTEKPNGGGRDHMPLRHPRQNHARDSGKTMAHEARARAHMQRMEHSPIRRVRARRGGERSSSKPSWGRWKGKIQWRSRRCWGSHWSENENWTADISTTQPGGCANKHAVEYGGGERLREQCR